MKIKLRGESLVVEDEDSLADIFAKNKISKEFVACLCNKRTVDLNYKPKEGDELEPISKFSDSGRKIYTSSLCLLFILAAKKVLGEDVKVLVEYSIGNGIYISLERGKIRYQQLSKIEDCMHSLVNRNLKIERETVSKKVAETLFSAEHYDEKVELLNSLDMDKADIYIVDGKAFSFNNFLVPSTSYLRQFSLVPYYPGLIILFPLGQEDNSMVFQEQADLVKVNNTSRKWIETIDVKYAGRLNLLYKEDKLDRLIKINETYFNNQIHLCSRKIIDSNIRIVLLAGPSSSGKTTTAKKLAIQLAVFGKNTYVLSTDDYYVDRENTPKTKDGDYDFESIYAVDIKRLNSDLLSLLEGNEVRLPKYNFKTGKSEMSDRRIRLNDNNLLIIEGIHALNPLLTKKIPDKDKYKVYVSALTQVNIDSHNRISSSDARLIRRLVRDNNFRGYSAKFNLSIWENVRKGEKKYIFPFQENADFYLDSSLVYEFNALKSEALRVLSEIGEDSPYYNKAKSLEDLLDNFIGMEDFRSIPNDSILREFIGDKL